MAANFYSYGGRQFMITYIEGTIHYVEENALVVLVGGIGYLVYVPASLIESRKRGESVQFYTYQHIREDMQDLYGFQNRDDLLFFKQLIQVSGVGPRLAMAVMSRLAAEEIKRAIIHGDISLLTSMPGVGRKTAERIILELKESIDVGTVTGAARDAAVSTSREMSPIDALIALGYTKLEALDALRGIDSSLPIEAQVKNALKNRHTS